MNGNKLFVDTNIILYLLAGDETLAVFLNKKQLYLSSITELELLSFDGLSKEDELVIRDFLSQCKIIPLTNSIKEETISIRRRYKLKLPDSIIIASCLELDLPMITADSDFKRVEELTLIHYEK